MNGWQRAIALVAALASALSSSAALAEDASGAAAVDAAHAPAAIHDFSITMDVTTMLLFEAAVEVRLGPKWSTVGEMMLGQLTTDGTTGGVYLLGGQARYYVLGTFEHGLDLAAAVDYLGVSTTDQGAPASGTALILSGMLGYKFVASFGLTVDLQLGAAVVAIRAESASRAEEKLVPTTVELASHLRLGWSF